MAAKNTQRRKPSGNPTLLVGFLFACLFGGTACEKAQQAPPSPVVINEFMAGNFRTKDDPYDESDDWVELHNTSDSTVDVGGMYLTDNLRKPDRWRIPDSVPKQTRIPAHGYLLLWMDKQPEQGPLHANFKLNKKSGVVALFSSDGRQAVDQVHYGQQRTDVSWGRDPAAPDQWTFFQRSTPGHANREGPRFDAIADAPIITPEASFHDGPQTIKIKAPDGGKLYYTLDGSTPKPLDSLAYTGPIRIDSHTVVRAIAVNEGELGSKVTTHSYFIGEVSTVPVVSLVVDPVELWDRLTGIYANAKIMMEKAGHVEFFEDDRSRVIAQDIGVKVAGGVSKVMPKKPFTLYARKAYGKRRFKHRFFAEKDIESFSSLFLRSDPSCGIPGDWYMAGERLKNELIHKVNKQMGNRLDMQAYRPVSVYLNGKYWGLYNLMERKGLDFVRTNYGYETADIINGQHQRVVAGSRRAWNEFITFLNQRDLRDPGVYAQVKSQMDIPNFIDYWIIELYTSTRDHYRNIRWWKPHTPDGKWRWIAFDFDSWYDNKNVVLYNFTCDTTAHDWNLLGRMMLNPEFRRDFINRTCDYLNLAFLPENVDGLIEEILDEMGPEKQRDYDRWKPPIMRMVEPGVQKDWIRYYVRDRGDELRNELRLEYGLGPVHELEVDVQPADAGTLTVNTLDITQFPWKGKYLAENPFYVYAHAKPGYRFVRWEPAHLEPRRDLFLNLNDNLRLVAVFEAE